MSYETMTRQERLMHLQEAAYAWEQNKKQGFKPVAYLKAKMLPKLELIGNEGRKTQIVPENTQIKHELCFPFFERAELQRMRFVDGLRGCYTPRALKTLNDEAMSFEYDPYKCTALIDGYLTVPVAHLDHALIRANSEDTDPLQHVQNV